MAEVYRLAELEEQGIIKLGRGKVISKKDLNSIPGSFPVYSSSKVGDGFFGKYGDFMFEEELITWSVDGGGNLFHREKHKFSITNVSGFLRILRTDLVSYKYLYYCLVFLHSGINFDWVKKAHPSVLRKKYNHIPLPPLPVQKQIVKKFDAAFADIDKAMSATQKNIENAEALFKKYISESPGELVELDKLVTIKTGKLNFNAAVESGKYPFFTCSREIFSIDEYAFDCEALLLAGNNASGDFNVKHYQGKFNAYQRTYVITINNPDSVLYRHLYFQLLNSLADFKKMSVGANTKFLKLGMIKTLKVPLPSIASQQKYLSSIEIILQQTEILKKCYESKSRLLENLKSSILTQAFSGELIKDAV